MIYVDQLIAWPQKANGRQAQRIFGEGKQSCHMLTDGPIEELHEFAARLGLKREWFQPHAIAPHYDLTPKRRADAVRLGAKDSTYREWRATTKAKAAQEKTA